MNNVIIRLNPYKETHSISINGKPLSLYSELNNYLNEPFLEWADKVFHSIEVELNDNFILEVIGEEFEHLLLKQLSNSSDLCNEVIYRHCSIDISLEKRLEMLREFYSKNKKTSLNLSMTPLVIDSQTFELDEDTNYFIQSNKENARVLVVDDISKINMNEYTNVQIVICSGEKEEIQKIDNIYFWYEYQNSLRKLVDTVGQYFLTVNTIKNVLIDLEPKEIERNEFIPIIETEFYIQVNPIEKIEVGERVDLSYRTIPSNIDIPNLQVRSLNPEIAIYEDKKIIGLKKGVALFEFFKNQENIPFQKMRIEVIQLNYIQKLEIAIEEKTMGIGHSQSINLKYLPIDAEDVDDIKWHFSSNAIEVSDGKIIAKSQGVCTISVQSKLCHADVTIEVKPQISKIILSKSSVKCDMGDKVDLTYEIEPKEVYNNQIEWKTSNSKVAIVDKDETGNHYIRTCGIGTCEIQAVAHEGTASSICHVEVESTLYKKENKNNLLGISVIFGILPIILRVFNISILICISSILVSICLGLISYKKVKCGFIWVLIAILIGCISIFY